MLSRARIASPCPMKWDDMHAVGDGMQVRHCDQCNLNVYNLSEMRADEAEALLVAHEGRRLCGAFYRRQDGTILTRDCPVGLALVRARLAKAVARVSAAAGLILTGVVMLGAKARGEPIKLSQVDPFAKIVAWLNPAAPPSPFIGGKVVLTAGYVVNVPPSAQTIQPAPLAPQPLPAPANVVDLTGGSP
jgi:hypothetical protein